MKSRVNDRSRAGAGAAVIPFPVASMPAARPSGDKQVPGCCLPVWIREENTASAEVRVSFPGRMAEGVLDHPAAAVVAWRRYIEPQPWYSPERECLVVFVLNAQRRLMGWHLVSIGSATETTAYPRDVLRPVVAMGAVGFMVCHNHPSGCVKPSVADCRITRCLRDAARMLGVECADHVIVGTAEERLQDDVPLYSFRHAGRL